MNTNRAATDQSLPEGYSLRRDAGADWWLHGPADAPIFLAAGEAWLLDAFEKSEHEAIRVALEDLSRYGAAS